MDNISVTATKIQIASGNFVMISSVHGDLKVCYEYIEDGEKKVCTYKIIETKQHKLRMEK